MQFTTLFGLLAVELAVEMVVGRRTLTGLLSATFLAVAMFLAWRSFYGMRIKGGGHLG